MVWLVTLVADASVGSHRVDAATIAAQVGHHLALVDVKTVH